MFYFVRLEKRLSPRKYGKNNILTFEPRISTNQPLNNSALIVKLDTMGIAD